MSKTKFDAWLDLFAWGFSGLALLNRKIQSQTGSSLGEAVNVALNKRKKFGAAAPEVIPRTVVPTNAVMRKNAKSLKRQPVKVTEITPKSVSDRVKLLKKRIITDSHDPRVREIAASILSKKCNGGWCIAEKDWLGEVEAVFAEVRKRIRYTRDIRDRDTFVSAQRTLVQYHIGDCDDFVISLGAILHHIGYPLKIRVIQTTGNMDFNHVYLVVGIPPGNPNQWYAADASVSMPLGFQAPESMVVKFADYVV